MIYKMELSRLVQYIFFFTLLAAVGYVVWLILWPFASALALAAIIVTICYPLYERILKILPGQNRSLAAFLSTVFIFTAVVLPIIFLSSLVVREMVGVYQDIETGQISVQTYAGIIESNIQQVIPGFSIDLHTQIKHSLEWLTGNLGDIFAGTVSTIFVFFIALIGSFYFFRDGKEFVQLLIKASPLSDQEDQIIFERMARAARAVATGTVLVALIQGTLVALGFSIVGVPRAILWGSVASLGALIPGVGTSIVTVPAAIYLFVTGQIVGGVILLIWSVLLVGMIDNLLGPYLMSRGNNLHPFIVLLAVLGGMALFGPIGFVIGPVVVTLFLVLLELYNQYIAKR